MDGGQDHGSVAVNFSYSNSENEAKNLENAKVVPKKGLKIQRAFSNPNRHPYDEIIWETRSVEITDEAGIHVFKLDQAEVPKIWSQTATTVVASKYFRRNLHNNHHETSARQLVNRVVETLENWCIQRKIFQTEEDVQIYGDELTSLLINQYASFNSPVWFNVGVEPRPQCSACFILSVTDTMESILDLAKTEGMLFKFGSGSGTNFSSLRSSFEYLSGGGKASGPVSFMKGFDSFAGVIKSGGKTRRAAKMVILNIDHPDIIDFIETKGREEQKAWALIDSGYSSDFNAKDGAYNSIQFQNANHSVRVTDEFMKAVEKDKEWQLRSVTKGEVLETYPAKEIFNKIAMNTHVCGDPGVQFDTTINEWHTCPDSGRINASNPCSEYMFLDNTACNLASLNLLKFRRPDAGFDLDKYLAAVRTMIIAQENLVDDASYPTKKIEENSHHFRPLGLGYTNLGAFLMSLGIPYDSDKGRAWAALLTALLTGQAYLTSAEMAQEFGPFPGYEKNTTPMLKVIQKHKAALDQIESKHIPKALFEKAKTIWQEAYNRGMAHGYRNAQVSVLAPTGTIAFMMDCDTTGIEPDLSLVKYKKLVGGGTIQIVNKTVAMALNHLGYSDQEIEDISQYIQENNQVEGAAHLDPKHFPIFDTAFKPSKSDRFIHYMGHVKMMAAVQPFLSGAISKTVNLPEQATPEQVAEVYMKAWKLGLKSIAIYRDNSKRTQPLSTSKKKEGVSSSQALLESKDLLQRRRLPDERQSITHKFTVGGHKGYITVGMYEDGSPGEIFLVMSKEGSTISGLMDAFATSVSMSLQYGVPLKEQISKFIHSRFEPSGWTDNPKIRIAKSLLDYIFRWMALKFLPKDEWKDVGLNGDFEDDSQSQASPSSPTKKITSVNREDMSDSPSCFNCGGLMQRSGSCYVCPDCGETTGCG